MMINRVSKLISACLKISVFIILGFGYLSGNLHASGQSCTEGEPTLPEAGICISKAERLLNIVKYWDDNGYETPVDKLVQIKSKAKQHTHEKKSNKVTRIKFSRGAFSSVVMGKLKGFDSEQNYVIAVGKGQTLSVEQIDRRESQYVSVYVTAPNGEDVNDMDLSCHSNANVSPTVAGDYIIKVVECLKADLWKGRYSLKVTIK